LCCFLTCVPVFGNDINGNAIRVVFEDLIKPGPVVHGEVDITVRVYLDAKENFFGFGRDEILAVGAVLVGVAIDEGEGELGEGGCYAYDEECD
jgi:hypothetical protein